MRRAVVVLIRFYQRYISPYKGYRCAHAYYRQGDSCSEAIRKLVIEHGVVKSLPLARKRFQDCRTVYLIESQNDRKEKRKRRWRNCLETCDCYCQPDVIDCIPTNYCDSPTIPCDCSLLPYRGSKK
ncbi:membrane protein insertion efficiency factor YidD [Photobacterium aquae]|uniref:membrane protein insertion efficiency factor YidD n=1 Tax=Photobacterium aquae TaxID=1195763 RepID=UPI000A05FBB6